MGDEKDIPSFFESHREEIVDSLAQEIREKRNIKWFISLECVFTRHVSENEVEKCTAYFRSTCMTNLTEDDLISNYEIAYTKILTSFDSFEGHGSGWVLNKIAGLDINVGKYEPLAPTSYIKLPKELSDKHAIINIKNDDQKCFLWSILAGLFPVENHPERVNKYFQHLDKVNFEGINFPTPLNDIKKFEKLNKISINVFGYERKVVFPLHVSKLTFDKHINLLLISDKTKSHYCYIKSMSRLLNDLTKHKAKSFYCNYCLQRFSSNVYLEKHGEICKNHTPQRVEFPNEDNNQCKFKSIFMQMRVPFIIYADFESFNVKTSGCENSSSISHEDILTHHIPCGYAYIIIGPTGKTFKGPVVYRGDDVVNHFLNSLLGEKELRKELYSNKKMIFTEKDKEDFKNATMCYICHGVLSTKRARDHCHITGKYRGATHPSCNLNLKIRNKIPVVFHNLKGYDSHLIMQSIGQFKEKKIECIANNMQKFISFSLGDLQFIDSLQFLPSSLEKLVSGLDLNNFNIMKEYFNDEELNLLARKGVYPYSYIDCKDKFLEEQLPPQEAFFDDLNCAAISDEDYRHAQKVWTKLNIKNLGEYHDLYIKTDILLLADIFENFRSMCIQFYDLDPAHSITLPSYAWQAALKKSSVTLQLLTDPDMYLFFEKGIRGGISVISKRYSQANNKYLSNFDSNKPSKYIIYFDANNLYGWALSQPLPIAEFQWLSQEEIKKFNPSEINDEDYFGYVIEADLLYPTEIHDDHDSYPLAPERMDITPSILSNYALNLAEELNLPISKKQTKLVPNLNKKSKYILHIRNLQLYLSLGMKLEKIHRILRFHQSPWLKSYVEFNTQKRKEAKTAFEKDLFKLMNNAVFGKTMENLRNRVNIKLVQNDNKFKKLISSPSFNYFKILNEDLVAVHMHKKKLKLDRPIYAGFSVLDISKTLMYNFHYNTIKKMYGKKAELLFTDTDSLCYEIETHDLYQDLKSKEEEFDFSEYDKDHPLHSDVNKKIIGKMKDELNGNFAVEFIGLRPKMYSLKIEEYEKKESVEKKKDLEKKTAKGISKNVIKKTIHHKDYYDCLFEQTYNRIQQIKIASKNHILYTVKQTKIGLSCYDDKRYLLDDGITSYAYGNYKI